MAESNLNVRTDPPVLKTVEPTMTELVTGIMNDAVKLMRQQGEMFQAEMREDVAAAKKVAQYGGVAVVLLTLGVQALILGAGFFLAWAFPDMPLWVAFAVVGGLTVTCGVVFYFVAKGEAHFNPLPDKSLHALKENLSWKT